MKKSLLLWRALMASTSALAEGGKEIRFGVDPTFAPFEWKDPQGKLAGFDIDLGNAICQQLQAKCVWVESNFDGIIPALKARKFDAILSGMYMTEKRKAQIAFSDKLYNGPVFLVARKNTLQGNTPEQLKGKTIGVEQGSAQETYVNLAGVHRRDRLQDPFAAKHLQRQRPGEIGLFRTVVNTG